MAQAIVSGTNSKDGLIDPDDFFERSDLSLKTFADASKVGHDFEVLSLSGSWWMGKQKRVS
jgi:hypothetical protein